MASNSQVFLTPWWWLRLSGRNMLEWLNNNKLINPELICAFCWLVLFFKNLWNLILGDFTKKKMWNHFNFHVGWRVLMITLHEDVCLIWLHVGHIPLLHMCVRVFIPTLCMHIHICSVHVFTWRLCTHMPSSYLAELLCCCFDTASHKLSAASNL